MPNKWTFKQPKLLKFISKYIPYNSKVLIPFAGEFRFGSLDNNQYFYNDINKEIKADYNIDAIDLKDYFEKHYFDCIIADPPFSLNLFYAKYAKAKKEGTEATFRTEINKWKDTAQYLLKPNGIYIQLGYNTNGIRNANKIALGICQIGSVHNDILILVQQKNNTLNEFLK
jgi:hypothetical protein